MILTLFTFAGDDENQALSLRMGTQDKADQFGMRLGQRHSMQVNAGLGCGFASRQVLEGPAIHPNGLGRKSFGDCTGKIVPPCRIARSLPYPKGLGRRLRVQGLVLDRTLGR